METGLAGKLVLITGANGGIGSAIVKAFLKEGSTVVGQCRHDISKLKPLIDWVSENRPSGKFLPIIVDLHNKDDISRTVDSILVEYKKIDVLVNNAGNLIEKPFLITEQEDWEKLIEVHLTANILLTKEVLRHMFVEKQGAIVNVTSMVGKAIGRGVSAYASLKAAVNRLTEVLAMESGQKGIRINAVAPGLIDTHMSKALQERFDGFLKNMIVMGRYGFPDEVAKAVIFLSSEELSSYITGHVLTVDGGLGLW